MSKHSNTILDITVWAWQKRTLNLSEEREVGVIHRVRFTMRYTRFSCSPFMARLPIERFVEARDEDDALHQACHCLDRDLEEIFANINAQNVSEIYVDQPSVQKVEDHNDAETIWNPEPFDSQQEVPRYIVVRQDAHLGLL